MRKHKHDGIETLDFTPYIRNPQTLTSHQNVTPDVFLSAPSNFRLNMCHKQTRAWTSLKNQLHPWLINKSRLHILQMPLRESASVSQKVKLGCYLNFSVKAACAQSARITASIENEITYFSGVISGQIKQFNARNKNVRNEEKGSGESWWHNALQGWYVFFNMEK